MFGRRIAEHNELRGILDRMPALLENGDERSEESIRQCRWEMSRLLFQHLARKEREVYTPLDPVDDPALQRLANEFRSDLEAIHQAFQAHMKKWSTLSIVGQWYCHRNDVIALNGRLLDRFDREERFLFPRIKPEHVESIGAVRHNWIRDVWSFRDQIMS